VTSPRLPAPFALASTRVMNGRRIFPRKGMKAHVESFPPYYTPPDWPHDLPVEVMDHSDPMAVRVRDAAGRERGFLHWNLDAGMECEIAPGRWVHETDPLAIAARQSGLAQLMREVWPRPVEGDREAAIAWMGKRLERLGNGRDFCAVWE
jgi:hypothetical protein